MTFSNNLIQRLRALLGADADEFNTKVQALGDSGGGVEGIAASDNWQAGEFLELDGGISVTFLASS